MGMNSLMEFLVSMLKIDENKPSNAFYSIERHKMYRVKNGTFSVNKFVTSASNNG
jgi:hypothetical protein